MFKIQIVTIPGTHTLSERVLPGKYRVELRIVVRCALDRGCTIPGAPLTLGVSTHPLTLGLSTVLRRKWAWWPPEYNSIQVSAAVTGSARVPTMDPLTCLEVVAVMAAAVVEEVGVVEEVEEVFCKVDPDPMLHLQRGHFAAASPPCRMIHLNGGNIGGEIQDRDGPRHT